jgi:predicted deacylase
MEDLFCIAGQSIKKGESKEIKLKVSESYTSIATYIPITVLRGVSDGPIVFITAAVHGDELNGIEIVRRIIYSIDLSSLKGTLVCLPIVNIFGFQNSSRYLPDGSDLNRFFPGNSKGNFVKKYASIIFKEIIKKCQYGIDIHTAAIGRSNLPHVRADMNFKEVKRMAVAFGTTIIKNESGAKGSLRRTATEANIPTIIFEAGEIRKFELAIAKRGFDGVLNALSELGMIEHKKVKPPYQVIVDSSKWIRANRGGLLSILVKPGNIVYKEDEIAVNTNPFGKEVEIIKSPINGIIIGIATDPTATPGQPICHMVELDDEIEKIKDSLKKFAYI